MLTMQAVILLFLGAQSVVAGPLRRPLEKSNNMWDADVAKRHPYPIGDASPDDISLIRFHQTATAYPSTTPTFGITNGQPAQSGAAPSSETPPPMARSRKSQRTTRSGQTRVTEHPDSGQSRFPEPRNTTVSDLGGHNGQSDGPDDTTTLTVTTTVYPSAPAGTSALPNQGGQTRPDGVRGTGDRVRSESVNSSQASSSEQPSGSSQPVSSGRVTQSRQAAPKTTFVVLGSQTLRVTVSQHYEGIASSAAVSPLPPSSNRHTTTTITQVRTRVATTTVTPDASSSSPAEPSASSPIADGQSRQAATGHQTLPTTFPHFSFAPPSSATPSPTEHPHRTTDLPSIITPYASGSSNAPAPSSGYVSSASAESSSSLPPSTSSTGVAGITIIPVNPDATTIYVTVTDAGATTTVARVTVTAQPS